MFLEGLMVRRAEKYPVARQERPLGQRVLDGAEITRIPGPGAHHHQALPCASDSSQHRLAQFREALQKPRRRPRAGHLALMSEKYLWSRAVDRAQCLPVSDARRVPSQFPPADHARGNARGATAAAQVDLLDDILKGPVPG